MVVSTAYLQFRESLQHGMLKWVTLTFLPSTSKLEIHFCAASEAITLLGGPTGQLIALASQFLVVKRMIHLTNAFYRSKIVRVSGVVKLRGAVAAVRIIQLVPSGVRLRAGDAVRRVPVLEGVSLVR